MRYTYFSSISCCPYNAILCCFFSFFFSGLLLMPYFSLHLKPFVLHRDEKEIDFAEQLESVAYVLCGEGTITFEKFISIWNARGVSAACIFFLHLLFCSSLTRYSFMQMHLLIGQMDWFLKRMDFCTHPNKKIDWISQWQI